MTRRDRALRRLLIGLAIAGVTVGAVLSIDQLHGFLVGKESVDQSTYLGTAVGLLGVEIAIITYLAATRRLGDVSDRLTQAVTRDLAERLGHVQLAGPQIELTLTEVRSGEQVVLSDFLRDSLATDPLRCVITGDPGAGKSFTTLNLARALLRAGAIPVLLPLSRWRVGLSVDEMIRGYLSSKYVVSAASAKELATLGRLVPILDGLDEIDSIEDARYTAGRFLIELRSWMDARPADAFILTCQSELWQEIEQSLTHQIDVSAWHVEGVRPSNAENYLRLCLREPLDSLVPGQVIALLESSDLGMLVRRASTLSMLGVILRDGAGRLPPLRAEDFIANVAQRGLVPTFLKATLQAAPSRISRLQNAWSISTLHVFARYLSAHHDPDQGELFDRVLEDRDIRLHRLWPIAGRTAPRVLDLIMALVLSVPGLTGAVVFLLDRGSLGEAAAALLVVLWMAALVRTTLKPWVRPAILELRQLRRPQAMVKQTLTAVTVGVLAQAIVGSPALSLAAATSTWLAVGLTVGFGQSLTTDFKIRELGPAGVLHREHVISRIAALTLLPLVCYDGYLNFGEYWGIGLGLLYVFIVGETVASALWRRYLALCLLELFRLRCTPSLACARAYQLQIMRINGTDYRFRNEELQSFFTNNQVPLQTARRLGRKDPDNSILREVR